MILQEASGQLRRTCAHRGEPNAFGFMQPCYTPDVSLPVTHIPFLKVVFHTDFGWFQINHKHCNYPDITFLNTLVGQGQGQDGQSGQGGHGIQVGPSTWSRSVLYCSFVQNSKVAVSQPVSQ